MNVTVFGATGQIGLLVVHRLLDLGHEVTVLVRSPEKLAIDPALLTVVLGELSDAEAVERVVVGADAVISALGPPIDPRVGGSALTDGTRTIVTAMERAGVRRFVALSTVSIKDPRDRPSLVEQLLPAGIGLLLPNALEELQGMAEVVTTSDLDWTLVRITAPNDDPPMGTVRAGFLGRDGVGSPMTRADVAAFLVDQLADTRFIRAAPAISN